MSSFWGSVCLLVVLGVVFVSGSGCHFISENLTQTHDIIADALGLKEPEVAKIVLFSPVVKSIGNSNLRKERVQLMNATLDVYMHVFSSILQHKTLLGQVTPASDRPRVESALKQLRHKMEMVRNKLAHQKHDGEHQIHVREDVMGMLNKIKVDDAAHQKTALAEYKEVYQAASVAIYSTCGRGHTTSANRRR